jgi:hypothetical protein
MKYITIRMARELRKHSGITLLPGEKLPIFAEKYLDKGSEVVIEGKLVNRNYNGKDGNKKFITEVQVNEMLLLGREKKEAVNLHPCRTHCPARTTIRFLYYSSVTNPQICYIVTSCFNAIPAIFSFS